MTIKERIREVVEKWNPVEDDPEDLVNAILEAIYGRGIEPTQTPD